MSRSRSRNLVVSLGLEVHRWKIEDFISALDIELELEAYDVTLYLNASL